jgi:hypothetical protein
MTRRDDTLNITNCITNSQPNTNVEDYIKETVKETYYGYEKDRVITVGRDDRRCIAKEIYTTNKFVNSTHYWLLFGQNNELYTPFQSYQRSKDLSHNRQMGQNYWSFRKISDFCFELYIRYLNTKNEAHYIMAERESRK